MVRNCGGAASFFRNNEKPEFLDMRNSGFSFLANTRFDDGSISHSAQHDVPHAQTARHIGIDAQASNFSVWVAAPNASVPNCVINLEKSFDFRQNDFC